jgi:hypothetical protein
MTRLRVVGIVAVGAILLGGCALDVSPGSDPIGTISSSAVPSPGELVGRGTVLQQGAELPKFCLGGVRESYPPQCSGPVIRNWDWSAVDESATASDVTWGEYELTGTWDGVAFTQTKEPIPLHDAAPPADPSPGDGPPGAGDELQLSQIQAELHSSADLSILGSWTTNGYLVLNVVYDDGALQSEMDSRYGPNLILVKSALRPVVPRPA